MLHLLPCKGKCGLDVFRSYTCLATDVCWLCTEYLMGGPFLAYEYKRNEPRALKWIVVDLTIPSGHFTTLETFQSDARVHSLAAREPSFCPVDPSSEEHQWLFLPDDDGRLTYVYPPSAHQRRRTRQHQQNSRPATAVILPSRKHCPCTWVMP